MTRNLRPPHAGCVGLQYVVFDTQSPWVPQLSACLEDVWTVTDALALLERTADWCADTQLLFTEQEDLLRRFPFACVVASPRVGARDAFLHVTILTFTSRGTKENRIFLHRRGIGAFYTALPSVPIDEDGTVMSWPCTRRNEMLSSCDTSFDVGLPASSAGTNSNPSRPGTMSEAIQEVGGNGHLAHRVIVAFRNVSPSQKAIGGDARSRGYEGKSHLPKFAFPRSFRF